jgi:phosphate starvation-inducible PhoH-like protein
MTEATISVVDSKALLSLFGPRDQHLRKIRDALSVEISARDDQIRIQGTETAVARATEVLEQLKAIVERQGSLEPDEVSRVLGRRQRPRGRHRRCPDRGPGQARYVQAIAEHDIVFCVGPAGTGKTYLAVAMAVAALKQERIRKIVLVRPAVEAGESLGFLPGDLQAKINPYLRPLLDACTK